jgi:hypothetical protein
MEGKAVWTGGAYGKSADENFVDNYASAGNILGAYIKGYAAPENLTKLLEGTIADYRDNYNAGHALFVYLRSRKDGQALPLPRAPAEYQQRARGRRGPRALRERLPRRQAGPRGKLDKFCADWGRGDFWFDLKPWAEGLTEDVGGAGSPEVIEVVWAGTARAEPRFGQGQASTPAISCAARGGARTRSRPTSGRWVPAAASPRSRSSSPSCSSGGPGSGLVPAQALAFPFGARTGPSPFLGQLPVAALLAGPESAANDARARAATRAPLGAERDAWRAGSARRRCPRRHPRSRLRRARALRRSAARARPRRRARRA